MKKNLFLVLLLLVVLAFVVFLLWPSKTPETSPTQPNQPQDNPETTTEPQSISIDFNGDGVTETLNTVVNDDGRVEMTVLDGNDKQIAILGEDQVLFPASSYDVLQLNENSPKQYLQWTMFPGPHQSETYFLTLIKDELQPIPSFDFEKKTMYSPFYNSRGDLVVVDSNNDGLMEVLENIDEYPSDSPRLNDKKIEDQIREEFSKQGSTEEEIQNFITIVNRENNGLGRGNKVIMAVHSFVDAESPFFRVLPQEEYEKIVGPLVKASAEVAQNAQGVEVPYETESFMRYSELEQESKDFNEFMRKTWTHGRPYEWPIPEDQNLKM